MHVLSCIYVDLVYTKRWSRWENGSLVDWQKMARSGVFWRTSNFQPCSCSKIWDPTNKNIFSAVYSVANVCYHIQYAVRWSWFCPTTMGANPCDPASSWTTLDHHKNSCWISSFPSSTQLPGHPLVTERNGLTTPFSCGIFPFEATYLVRGFPRLDVWLAEGMTNLESQVNHQFP